MYSSNINDVGVGNNICHFISHLIFMETSTALGYIIRARIDGVIMTSVTGHLSQAYNESHDEGENGGDIRNRSKECNIKRLQMSYPLSGKRGVIDGFQFQLLSASVFACHNHLLSCYSGKAYCGQKHLAAFRKFILFRLGQPQAYCTAFIFHFAQFPYRLVHQAKFRQCQIQKVLFGRGNHTKLCLIVLLQVFWIYCDKRKQDSRDVILSA